MRYGIFVLAWMLLTASLNAACTSPSSPAGGAIFNTTTKTLQYCNNTDWVNVGKSIPAATQTGCTAPTGVPGAVVYNGARGMVQYCNGQNWLDTACAATRTPGGPGCGGKPAGTMQYVAGTINELQFCDSTNWVAMGYGCSGSTPVNPTGPEVVAYVSSSTNNLNIQNLFTAPEWTSTTLNKRVVINSGVTVGSTSSTIAAILSGTGRGSALIIQNAGTIAGAGGAANGGAGGAAINAQQTSITVINTGNIYGGGGGGGKGGTGGQGGAGSTTGLVREPASGDYFSTTNPTYNWNFGSAFSNSSANIYWNGGNINMMPGFNTAQTSFVSGGYTYYRGTYQYTIDEPGEPGAPYFEYYGIYRTYSGTTATSGGTGGAGGNGGLGQGSNQTNTAGASGGTGAAGGTNAGAGGNGAAGGNGGTWGVAGSVGGTGGTGVAGNAGSGATGLTGNPGGAAGAAVAGTATTVQNTGTILGTY